MFTKEELMFIVRIMAQQALGNVCPEDRVDARSIVKLCSNELRVVAQGDRYVDADYKGLP